MNKFVTFSIAGFYLLSFYYCCFSTLMKKKVGMDIFDGKRDFEEGFHTALIFEEITTPVHNIIFINVSLNPLTQKIL